MQWRSKNGIRRSLWKTTNSTKETLICNPKRFCRNSLSYFPQYWTDAVTAQLILEDESVGYTICKERGWLGHVSTSERTAVSWEQLCQKNTYAFAKACLSGNMKRIISSSRLFINISKCLDSSQEDELLIKVVLEVSAANGVVVKKTKGRTLLFSTINLKKEASHIYHETLMTCSRSWNHVRSLPKIMMVHWKRSSQLQCKQ